MSLRIQSTEAGEEQWKTPWTTAFQTGENEVNKTGTPIQIHGPVFFRWGKMEVIFGYSNLVSFAFDEPIQNLTIF